MNEPKPIKIRPKLFQKLEAVRPEVFTETTTWVNYLVRIGLNFHLGLDPYGRLGKPTDKEEKKKQEGRKEEKKREVLPNSIENNIYKEKNKKWIFTKEQIPDFPFKSYKSLIINFWAEKSGAKSKEAFKLLIGTKGLRGIYDKYGDNAVKDQLEEAIANRWQSITLKNYELYGRPKKDVTEPVTNHPAQNVFRASDIYGEVQ